MNVANEFKEKNLKINSKWETMWFFYEVKGIFYVRLARNNVGNKRYICNAMLCYMPNTEGTHMMIQIIISIIIL